MLTIHLSVSIDAETDEDSANVLGEHLKDLIWKEVYETYQMPAYVATTYAERS